MRLACVLSIAALLTPRAGSGQGPVAVFNTRLAGDGVPWAGGDWGAFAVPEESRDLNGDGDVDDTVLFVADIPHLQVRNLGVALDPGLTADEDHPPVAIAGNTVAALVFEADQGNRDLNGDGDAKDNVLQVFDLAARTTTRTNVAGMEARISGSWVGVLTPEIEANGDLNGDGDLKDQVFQVYDLKTGQTWNSRLAGSSFLLAEDRAAVMCPEAAAGPGPGRDLNGDGDTADVVAQLVNLRTGKIDSSRLESSDSTALTPRLFAAAVSEARQGNRDLNGDGDTGDHVLQVIDLATMQPVATTWDASGDLAAAGTLVGFVTEEARQGPPANAGGAPPAGGKPAAGTDLNGDGDTRDSVAQVFDLATRQVTNLRQDASQGMLVGGGRVALITDEGNQGNHDLNGDKDADDLVLQVYDVARARLTNLKLAVGGGFAMAGNLVAVSVMEEDQGHQDLNGDRDTDDEVTHVYDAATGRVLNSRMACLDVIALSERAAVFFTGEYDQGNRDLNGNGNADDSVCQVYRIR